MKIKRHGFAITFVALALFATLGFSQQVHAAAPTIIPGTSLTDAQRQELIVQLTARVQALLAQVAALTGGASGTFSGDLQLGSTGSDVKALQVWLNAHGYAVAASGPGSSANESTHFGLRTYRALVRFQAAHGLPATGFFGPLTRGIINSSGLSPLSVSPSPTAVPISPSSNTAPNQSLIPQPWAPGNGYTPGFGGGGSDTTAPVISNTPSNTTVEATSGSGATVSYTSPTAADNVDGTVGVSCNPASASTFALGTTAVTCSATDRAGNTSSSSFTVTVQDTTAPVISSIASSTVTTSAATITWITDENSDSQFEYGTTNAYGATTTLNATLTTSHSVTLTGLTANTVYHYLIRSSDASGNLAVSSDQTFTTIGQTNLFWVGGTGNWSDQTHWALTTGGAGGAGVPAPNTNVTFDSNSGTSATVTVDIAAQAKTITINKSDLTLNDTIGMTISGAMTLTTGTLKTNGVTENWGSLVSSGSTARTLNIASSTINLSVANASAVSTSPSTSMTATLTGSTINCTGFSAGFVPGSLVFPNVTFTGAGNSTIGSGTYGNLTFFGDTSQLFDSVLGPGTLTITGTFTVRGATQNNRVLIYSQNTVRVITAAAVSLQNVEFRNITGAGAATWSGTTVGNVGGNTNITFSTPTTYYWIGNSGVFYDGNHWSLTSGGSSSGLVPLPQDTARFDANSFTLPGQQMTLFYSEISGMDWTGVTNNPNLLITGGANITGDIILSPNMTTSGDGSFNRLTWYRAGAIGTITTNGVPWPSGLSVNSNGGTLRLGDDFTQVMNGSVAPEGIVMLSGTFDAANHNVSLLGPVISQGSVTRGITLGTGTWTLKPSTGTIWNPTATGFALNSTGSTIKIGGTPTGSRTFAGGGLTYGNFEWAAEGVASNLIITGANVFNDFKVDADTAARTLTLPASATTTATTIELNGSSGNLLTVNSSTSGTQAKLSQAIGTAAGTFLSLKDSNAIGGATFAATSSVDAGNNTGWTITP